MFYRGKWILITVLDGALEDIEPVLLRRFFNRKKRQRQFVTDEIASRCWRYRGRMVGKVKSLTMHGV